MNQLFLLGLNHTTAPLDVRERLAFTPAQQRTALAALRERFDGCEAVLVSTCNRVELYVAHTKKPTPDLEAIAGFVAEFHSVPVEAFRAHLYSKRERNVVEHLFSVATSLDSMVLGETQILGQVRGSYDVAREVGSAGSILNPLFQRAIAVGKEVMSETALGEGRLSVASVAVDYARRIFETFTDKTILSIGAGEMASLVLQHFAPLKPKRLLICNRDPKKADALAEEFGGQAVAFESLETQLAAADVVSSSTGATVPIITRPQMQRVLKQRRYRPMFMIDIAVPRDVEAGVGTLDHIYLYNVDDLQQVVSATQAQRSGAVDSARAIVMRHVEEFITWHRRRELGPAIDKLYKRYHALAHEEVERTLHKLPALSESDRPQLDDLARRIVNKLLHEPVKALQNPDAQHLITPQYLHALERLFKLHEAPTEPNPPQDESADA